MLKIHPDAVQLISTRRGPVGWRLERQHFTFEAITKTDGTISVYIEWDDRDPEKSIELSWQNVKNILDRLLQSSTR